MATAAAAVWPRAAALGCGGRPRRARARAAEAEASAASDAPGRRAAALRAVAAAAALAAPAGGARAVVRGYVPPSGGDGASADGVMSMPGLAGKDYGKSATRYSDYVQLPSGLQYQELRVGLGQEVKEGDEVVVDWDGYTIGYYGRIIEAKNLSKGGAFDRDDFEYLRFVAGSGQVIGAFNEAVLSGARVGAIRRIIVPPGPLNYPETPRGDGTQSFDLGVGPVPSTFTGRRALDFVLKDTGLMDKTLLFDIEILDTSKGAPRRGPGEFVGVAKEQITRDNAIRDGRGERMRNSLYGQE